MGRQSLLGVYLGALGFGMVLAAVPGCGPDAPGESRPPASALTPSNDPPGKPSAHPTSPGPKEATSRRQRQKSFK